MFFKLLFEKITKIWFWYKEKTIKNDLTGWAYAYSKVPLGSKREELAFRRMIEIWAKNNKNILKAYPDCSPPDVSNILRKYAFAFACYHAQNSFAVLLRSALAPSNFFFGDGKPSEFAEEKSKLHIEKCNCWDKFLLSIPNSKDEEYALKELKRLEEVFPHTVIGNYIITIE